MYLCYSGGIFPMRAANSVAHLRSLVPGQHSSDETLLWWQALGNTVSNLTDLVIKSQTSCIKSDVLSD